MEEFCFMNPRVIDEVALPLASVEDTAVIIISTPADEYNLAMRIIFMEDDSGNSYFHMHMCQMRCEACIKSKVLDCTHMDHLRPQWKGKERGRMVEKMMGDSGLVAREMGGVVVTDGTPHLDIDKVKEMLDMEPYRLSLLSRSRPDYLIMACDPNGGGTSHTAIVTLAYSSHYTVILGVESHCTKESIEGEAENKRQLLEEHVKAIRKISILENVKIIFVPESNLGVEAYYMSSWMSKLPGVITPSWGPNGKVGFFTTNQSKETAYNQVNILIKQNNLIFMENMVCANPFLLGKSDMDVETLRDMMKKETVAQLCRMRKFTSKTSNAQQIPTVVVSGKVNERGNLVAKQNDDIVMALFIAILSDQIILSRGLGNL